MFEAAEKPFHNVIFDLFPLLPTELRLHIWTLALHRERLIRVNVSAVNPNSDSSAAAGYRVHVDGYKLLSKLMRVTFESRQAVLAFYRVHLPCTLGPVPPSQALLARPPNAILYLNPEFDYLELVPSLPLKETFIKFLHDLKISYDPMHVGILNLAMNMHVLNTWDIRHLEPTEIDQGVREGFAATLTQLRQVFFVLGPSVGRQNFGLFSGMNLRDKFYNRSIPIMSRVPTFERLRDPRPISEDLKRVYVGSVDPRVLVGWWNRVLRKWEVSSSQTQYRYLMTFKPLGGRELVQDRESMRAWLDKEEDWWKQEGDPSQSSENVVESAAGFWLVPLEALTVYADAATIGSSEMMDLTGHWPELALMDVS